MIALYRKLYGLQCPACQHPQPVFALSTTYQGGLVFLPLNAYVNCVDCPERLRIVARYSFGSTVGFQITFAIASLLAFVFIFLPILTFCLFVFGMWGLILWPVLLVFWILGSSAVTGAIGPLYREVQTL